MSKITVGIIGSGAMGAGIAQVAATFGNKVYIYDTALEALNKAQKNLENSLSKLVEKQKITAEKASEIKANSIFTNSLQDFSDCELVIEAIIENLDVKKSVFTQLEAIVSDNCMLATNTSSLSVTSIAAACSKSERVLGIHFFNPATLMPLVEIIPALQTNMDLLQKAKAIIDSWEKVTVIVKDTPGFIVNRVARSFYGEAIRIYEEGIADMSTIDWAMKEFGKFRMGPFELMDFIGNDINYKVTETVWEQFFYDQRFKPSFTQKRLFEAGRFGRKSGRGYYDYSLENPFPEPKKDEIVGKAIFTRVLVMLINEAVDSCYLKVASAQDLDLAMTKGVNYPKGLLQWCDEIGANVVLAHLNNLYNEYSEDRYRPSILLKKMAESGKKFF